MPSDSADPDYCCVGCRVVAQLIAGHDLERFYELGGGQPIGRAPRPGKRDWLPELVEAGALGTDRVRLSVDVQGMHCAGCVWLLNELWRRHDGALDIDVNPSVGRLTVVYDSSVLDLNAFFDDVERFGYRIAPARKQDSAEDRGLLVRVGVCAALAMNAMMFAFAEYLGLEDGSLHELFQWLSFALSTVAVAVGGTVFFRAALVGMRQRVLHLDQPIAAGILLAYSGSVVQQFVAAGGAYFDTVTIFVALMLTGRFLQRRALRANRNYLLSNVGADDLRVRVRTASGVAMTPITDVRTGDQLLLTHGDLVPVRARSLADATFSFDWINGESEPAAVAAGRVVPAGAFLRSNTAVAVEALTDVANSDLVELLATPRGERDDRSRSQFWSRLNRSYVAAVFVLAALAALTWLFLDASRAVEIAISVLVVTCPCALGLATPLAFDLALARLRRRGVYVRTTSLLEKARRVRKVVFDKTGTLTWGDLEAEVAQPVPDALRDVLLTMAHASGHPVSAAVAAANAGPYTHLADLSVEELPGLGLRVEVAGHEYRLGSEEFVAGAVCSGAESRCLFSCDGRVEAVFVIEEELRAGFRDELRALQAGGIEVHILSGDRQSKVDRVAAEVGVADAVGDLSPRDKVAHLQRIDRDDTMMVGDGLNDAPAFDAAFCAGAAALDRPVMPARADFFFLGGGSAAVRSVLTTGHLLHRVVRTNLWLAALYNTVALTFCFAGMMTPLLCAVLMPLSSLALIWHSVARLRA